MYFEQFYLGCLAHASYMLASEGEAVVIDPQRDVEIYLTAAAEHDLKIRHISLARKPATVSSCASATCASTS